MREVVGLLAARAQYSGHTGQRDGREVVGPHPGHGTVERPKGARVAAHGQASLMTRRPW
ncbi:hypothetical protein [Streptomyces sp. NPDC002676]